MKLWPMPIVPVYADSRVGMLPRLAYWFEFSPWVGNVHWSWRPDPRVRR